MKRVKVGQKIYVPTSLHLSRGSDDFMGGIATVSKVYYGISAGKRVIFICIKERPGTEYNWDGFLSLDQEKLKKLYENQVARPDPDEDNPWIEDGDWVDGKVYHGNPTW